MKKWLNSARIAFKGLIYFIKNERNGRIELVIALIVIPAGILLRVSAVEMSLLLICIGLIVAGEMVNTSIERMADFITLEHHKRIGIIKDLAAGAVFALSIIAALIGLLIFVPKILPLL